MPVNLRVAQAGDLHPVSGVSLGICEANIRKPNRKDLLVIGLADGCKAVGVFTQNRFCAAPVILAREHLQSGKPLRALIVNTGNANAGTGPDGMLRAAQTCEALAQELNCDATQILPFSTGVIMEPLPVDRIIAGLPQCIADLREDNWLNAAHAIMTTDTQPKAASRQITIDGKVITLTGIAKGAGMIHPNMATMLGFVATDAPVNQVVLEQIVKHAADRSFNRITIDGDTSTNDAFMLIASGQVDLPVIADTTSVQFELLQNAVTELAIELAQAIIRDGEGATKFITIVVEQGLSEKECEQIGFAIAHSPLVKTAFFASDPNLGRILAAIGYAGISDLDVSKIDLYLDDVLVAQSGGRNPAYQEADGQRVMKQSEITVRVILRRGSASSTFWTCDLSHDYVSINADYRS